jgi:hypothetical protein
MVEVLADWSFGSKPLRLGLPDRRPELNLDELGSACHQLIQFYMQAQRLEKQRSVKYGNANPDSCHTHIK